MKGRNAWDDRHFRMVFTKAEKIISCSFGVMGVRSKKTGKMSTIALFHDDEEGKFAYAFEFEEPEQVVALAHDLMKMVERIQKGEFGAPR